MCNSPGYPGPWRCWQRAPPWPPAAPPPGATPGCFGQTPAQSPASSHRPLVFHLNNNQKLATSAKLIYDVWHVKQDITCDYDPVTPIAEWHGHCPESTPGWGQGRGQHPGRAASSQQGGGGQGGFRGQLRQSPCHQVHLRVGRDKSLVVYTWIQTNFTIWLSALTKYAQAWAYLGMLRSGRSSTNPSPL